jgi:hypothetical protein
MHNAANDAAIVLSLDASHICRQMRLDLLRLCVA